MDSKVLSTVCNQIYRRFPEVDGVRPKVQAQSATQAGAIHLLIFKGKATTANGKTIPRIVRATVNDHGKIIKITTSR